LAEDTTRRASVEAGTRPRASALVVAAIVQAALGATRVEDSSAVILVVEAIREAAVILVVVAISAEATRVAVVIPAATGTPANIESRV
jgi:hypothetical protein